MVIEILGCIRNSKIHYQFVSLGTYTCFLKLNFNLIIGIDHVIIEIVFHQ